MAGDEDRLPAGPPAPAEDAAEIPAAEPSMAAGGADPAAAAGTAEPFAPRAPTSFGEGDTAVPPASGPARSIMPTVLAIIGVVLMLLLAANLYTLYNPPGNDAIPALQSAVAAQKQQIAALESRPPVDVAPLQTRLAGLADDITPLKAAVTQNAETAKAGADAKAAIGPLTGQVADLGKGLSGVQAAVAALPKVDLGPLNAKIAATETKLVATDDTVAATATKVAATDTKLADADKRLLPLEAYFNAPKTTAQVTQERQNGSAAETRAAPLAVIAQGILDDLASGRPFPAKTRALARLGVDAPTLAPLEAVATTGAATDEQLLAGFAGAEDGIVVAAAPISTGTMFDRMMANAQNLVKVSRTGAGPGEGADAVATRVVAALKAGSLPAAAAAWDKLPDASRARSAAWGDRLKARIAAEVAARSIASQAVDALAAAQ